MYVSENLAYLFGIEFKYLKGKVSLDIGKSIHEKNIPR